MRSLGWPLGFGEGIELLRTDGLLEDSTEGEGLGESVVGGTLSTLRGNDGLLEDLDGNDETNKVGSVEGGDTVGLEEGVTDGDDDGADETNKVGSVEGGGAVGFDDGATDGDDEGLLDGTAVSKLKKSPTLPSLSTTKPCTTLSKQHWSNSSPPGDPMISKMIF